MAPFNGRYSDGRSLAASDASVSLGATGLELIADSAVPFAIWRYADLTTAVPLAKGASEALVRCSSEPGATLFVRDKAFVAELVLRAPQVGATSFRWRAARPWMAVAAALIAVAVLISYSGFSPSRIIASLIPHAARSALGAQAMEALTKGRRACDQPAGRAALDKLTERLARASGATEPFKVIVVDWKLLNAFATAGNTIVLTRGTITRAESPDEVAGVLAHEMGHGLSLHPEAALIRAMGLSAGAQLIFTGTSSTVSNIGVLLAQLSYNRAAEREADAKAIEILRAAGIASKPLIAFFQRVEKQTGSSRIAKTMQQNDIIATHPPTPERIAFIEQQPAYPATPALSPSDWQALRGICANTP